MAIPLSPKDLQDQFIGPVKPNEAPPSFGEIDFLKESQFVGPRRPKALKASDIPFSKPVETPTAPAQVFGPPAPLQKDNVSIAFNQGDSISTGRGSTIFPQIQTRGKAEGFGFGDVPLFAAFEGRRILQTIIFNSPPFIQKGFKKITIPGKQPGFSDTGGGATIPVADTTAVVPDREILPAFIEEKDPIKQRAITLGAIAKKFKELEKDVGAAVGLSKPIDESKRSPEIFSTKTGGIGTEVALDFIFAPDTIFTTGAKAVVGSLVGASLLMGGLKDVTKKEGLRGLVFKGKEFKPEKIFEIFKNIFKKNAEKKALDAEEKFAKKVVELEAKGQKAIFEMKKSPDAFKPKKDYVEFVKEKIKFLPPEDLGPGINKFRKALLSPKNIDDLVNDAAFILEPSVKKGAKKLIPLAKTQTISDFVKGTVAPRLEELAPKLQKQILANERKLGRIPSTSLEDLASFVEIAGKQTVDLAKNLIDSEAGARVAFDTVDEASTFFRQINDLLPKNIAAIIKEQTAPLATRGVEVKTAGVVSKEAISKSIKEGKSPLKEVFLAKKGEATLSPQTQSVEKITIKSGVTPKPVKFSTGNIKRVEEFKKANPDIKAIIDKKGGVAILDKSIIKDKAPLQPRSGLKFTPKKGAKILKGGEAIPAGKDLGPEAVQGRIHPITASLKKIVKEAFGAPASRFQVVDIPRTPLTQKFIRKISNHPFALGFQELFHDRFARIVKALESTGIKFEDKKDLVTRLRLDPARLRGILEDVQKETTKKVVKEMFDVSKIEGVGKAPKEIQKLIGDFMRARHAPRLNKVIAKKTGGEKLAGSGITNKEAAKIKKEIENLPYFSKLKPIIDRLQEINNDTLSIALDGELISEKQYEKLLKTFKNEHVPLQRIIEGKEDQEILGVFFEAKGSEREVQDIVESILLNHQQTIKRSFTNKTRKIAADNFTEARKLGHPGARVIKGKKALQKEGLTIKDDMAVPFFEKGKKRVLVFDDALVAKALTGNNIWSLGKLDRAIEILGKITRLRANTFTTLNPEFPLINTVRDIQELFLTVDSTEGIVEASKATLQAASLKGQKSVFDYLRGAKSEGATLYKKLIDAGGAGSGLTAQNRKQFKVSVEKEFKALQRGKLNPIKAGQEIFKVLENVSTIFEDGTRLVAFDRALKRGATVDQAALIAKESTVNFDKRGTVGHILNSIWMFSNASIQGTARTIKSLSNPRTFIKASSLQLNGAIAQQRWNDSIDPEWRDKISDYERDNNYIILLPQDGIKDNLPRISIPVAWGLKPIKVMSDVFADIISGNLQPGDRSYDRLVSSLVTSYAPIQGSTIAQTIAPSVIVPFVQAAQNEKWNNAQIFPENRAGQVNNSEKEWNPDSDSILDRGARTVARRMKETIGVDTSPEVLKFLLSEVGGGTERALEKTFLTIESVIKGEENKRTSDIFVIGRIFKTTPSPQAKKRIIKKDRERVTNLIKDTFDKEKRKEILRDFAVDRDREEVKKDFNILRLKEDISAEGVKLTEKPRFPESEFNKETGAWDRPAWSEYYDYYRAPFNVYGGMTREEASVRADIQFFGGSVKDVPKKIKIRAVLLELEFRGELPPKKQEAIDELRRRGEFPPPL